MIAFFHPHCLQCDAHLHPHCIHGLCFLTQSIYLSSSETFRIETKHIVTKFINCARTCAVVDTTFVRLKPASYLPFPLRKMDVSWRLPGEIWLILNECVKCALSTCVDAQTGVHLSSVFTFTRHFVLLPSCVFTSVDTAGGKKHMYGKNGDATFNAFLRLQSPDQVKIHFI